MKLVRIAAFAFVALSAACASSSPAPTGPVAPTSNAVSTTHLNAAVWEEEATPRVGKPQRSDDASSAADEALDAPKDEPRRSESRRSWK